MIRRHVGLRLAETTVDGGVWRPSVGRQAETRRRGDTEVRRCPATETRADRHTRGEAVGQEVKGCCLKKTNKTTCSTE